MKNLELLAVIFCCLTWGCSNGPLPKCSTSTEVLTFLKTTNRSNVDIMELTGESYLNISNSDITDVEFKSIEKLSSLKKLDLMWCPRLTDTGLKSLEKLSELESLRLSGCLQITFGGLNLEKLTSLRYLDLSADGISKSTNITDAGLKSLEELTELESLLLIDCDKITDAGLKSLEKLSKLERLILTHCNNITDSGLKSLEKFTNLEHLGIRYCAKITEAGIKSFQKAQPDCTLYK